MNPIPNYGEQQLVARATLLAAKSTSESMEKFVHWTLAGAAAGLTYILAQKQFQITGMDHIGVLLVIAAVLAVVQRYISMIVTTTATVHEESGKLVGPNSDLNPEIFLLLYVNSLPVSMRFAAAWAAVNLLKGDLTTFPRYVFIAAVVQSTLGATVAILVIRCAYLVFAGVVASSRIP